MTSITLLRDFAKVRNGEGDRAMMLICIPLPRYPARGKR